MSKSAKKAADQAEREKVHKRYSNRREPDVIYPAKKQVDFYDADVHQRVAVYVRVSTDNLGQETSYELQKNYYEEFVLKHPNWKLVKIYADKGISGTSTKHRAELNQMLTDSRAGKIDLIITKSVSRLARNTVDCITMVRNLAELRNPVGVFFESECIFSLNEDTNMPLSFLASIAENESRIRSRSMEVSLAQRLNGGLPLTPKLLGYSHDADGKLVINPDEAPTVKLIFYMYLSGYSSSHIAKTLEALGKRTLAGVAKMVVAFGDQLRDETFKEKVGFMSVRQLSRIAKERGAGSLGYAEAMLVAYNRKCKYTLRMTKLHSGKVAVADDFVEENEEPLADDPVLEE